jgi:hypothetical protein
VKRPFRKIGDRFAFSRIVFGCFSPVDVCRALQSRHSGTQAESRLSIGRAGSAPQRGGLPGKEQFRGFRAGHAVSKAREARRIFFFYIAPN